jgi:hypothetical protein
MGNVDDQSSSAMLSPKYPRLLIVIELYDPPT